MAELMMLSNELLYQILRDLPEQDILKLCATNRQIADICQDPYLWRLKLKKEYPGIPISAYPRTQYRELQNVRRDYISRRYHNFNIANLSQWHIIEMGDPSVAPIEVFHLPEPSHYQYASSIYIYRHSRSYRLGRIIERLAGQGNYIYLERRAGDPPITDLYSCCTSGVRMTESQVRDRIQHLLDRGYIVTPRNQGQVPLGSDPIVDLDIPDELAIMWTRLGVIRITEAP